jgi:MOSC domain-containing protein YiiM
MHDERMDPDELERRFAAIPAPPVDGGTVQLIVVRKEAAHDQPARALVSVARGVHGDRWADGERPDPEAQVTLIERRVAELIAGGDRDRLHVHGDNFVVDLDLSLDALPVGTRLRLGTAVVEITAKPHAGCHKFRARFGDDVLSWVNAKPHRARRLRGVHARVVEDGEVAVGDRIARV